jgi:5-methylthioadenosine/S-adenosylhomocysteine deaminase
MVPARDPLRSLVYHAADRAVRDVWIDGGQVVREGEVLTMDQQKAGATLVEAQQRMIEMVPKRDYRKRTADEVSPLSLEVVP